MGQGGPLCLNPEGAIPIKRDFVVKNQNCYILHSMPKNTLKLTFWICGSLKIGGGGGWGVTDVLEKFQINIVCCLTDYLSQMWKVFKTLLSKIYLQAAPVARDSSLEAVLVVLPNNCS